MAYISKPPPPPVSNLAKNSSSSLRPRPRTCPVTLSFPFCVSTSSHHHAPLSALKGRPDGGSILGSHDSYGQDLLRKPVVSPGKDLSGTTEQVDDADHKLGEDGWVDWEDKILEDTVPLVGFVRMVLHSSKYRSGDRLSPEHERTILERLLPFHPEFEKKIGCGIDYITVGYHPDFESSRCLFIVQKDGNLVDFSYWKCIKGLIRKNYPLYADSFILRHFRKRRRRL